MNQCEFYEECGKAGEYFCENKGKKRDGTDAACTSYKKLEYDPKLNTLTDESWKEAFFRKSSRLMQGAIN